MSLDATTEDVTAREKYKHILAAETGFTDHNECICCSMKKKDQPVNFRYPKTLGSLY